jgi:serine protease AprX
MTKTIFLVFGLIFCVGSISAQDDRYVVYFSNKIGTNFSIDQPADFLSTQAISRRAKNSIQVVENDLPVSASYLSQVAATGATIRYTSRWFNCALIECSTSVRDNLRVLPFVQSVEYVAPGTTGSRIKSTVKANFKTSVIPEQLSMIGADVMHQDGFRGQGVRIAVFDSGFPGVETQVAFDSLRLRFGILDQFNFAYGTSDVYGFDDHGTEVFSALAANLGENFIGVAPDADYLLYVSEFAPSEYRVEEYYWLFAAERADSAGADIISSSLGYSTFDDASMNYNISELDGSTAVVTRAAQLAAEKGIIVVNSAGNEGAGNWSYILPPADGNAVIAVGAVDRQGARGNFSSIGPTSDGRIKPDLMAQGVLTQLVNANGQLIGANGTSFAAPIVSGLVAGIIQAFPDLTAVAIKEKLISSASRFSNPDNEYGYGIPNYNLIRNTVSATNGLSEKINVYPNPVSDGMIRLNHNGLFQQGLHIQIFDLLGHQSLNFKELSAVAYEITLDVSSLSAGVYILHVPEYQFRYRFIVR